MLCQKIVNLFADFLRVSIGRLFHCRKLLSAHVADDSLDICLQLGGIHAVQLVQLFEHQFLALTHTAFRGQAVEVFLEIALFSRFHLEYLRQAALVLPHVNFADFIIGSGKINAAVLIPEGKVLGKLLFVQQNMRAVRKERLRNELEELRNFKL